MKQNMLQPLSCTILLLTATIATAATPQNIDQAKTKFINAMVKKEGFNRKALTALLAKQQPNPEILRSMQQPFETKPWSFYRSYFLTDARIAEGAAYLKTHQKELSQLQKKYGIPPSLITAIIGIETNYGQHLGDYSVLNALYTLGFYYPPRAAFFQKELGQYLILARNNHLPVTKLKGSYAGAMGIPQFMPSSYRYFGVSTQKNGQVNLFKNADAIASVANYFHKNGWHPNRPITAQLAQKPAKIPHKATLTTLVLKHKKQYWATYHNFNVIMSYNHNVVYAMAAYQLSKAIDKCYETSCTA